MSVLVGIAGRSGSGKSLVADRLVSLADYDVISLATPLKAMAAGLLVDSFDYADFDVQYFLTHKTKKIPELGVTMRHLLQTLGTEWGRCLINPLMWVNIAADKIADQLDHTSVVVDDVRFNHEAEMIRNFDGLVIHLVRPGIGHDPHASEAGIAVEDGDAIVINDGSVLDLMQAISEAIHRHRCPVDRMLALCHTPCWSYVA